MLQCKTKWKKKKLGNLGYTYSGLSNKTIDDFGSGENFIPYMNIYKNSIIKTDKFEQVKIGLNEHQNQVQCGDVFFTTSSETPDEVGLTSVLIDKIDKSLYLNSFCFGFRLNDNNEFDNRFLAYLLRGENVRYQISKMAQGSTRYNLSKTQLLDKLKLYYPEDKKEQSRIANILLGCDKVIEKTEETIEKYKQIKAGMMQDLFTRGLDENGKLRPKYEDAPELYKYSEELDRYIPKDWDVKPLEYNTTLIKDGTHGTHKDIPNGIPLLSAKDIQDGDIIIPDDCRTISKTDYLSIHKNYSIEVNDVLLTIVGTIGRVAIVKSVESPFTFQRSVAIIKLIEPKLSNYIYYYLLYENTQKQLLAMMNASAQGGLYLGQLANVLVTMPKDKDEINNISQYLNKFDTKIKAEEQYLNKYKQIKQGLMKKLLTPPVDAEIVEE